MLTLHDYLGLYDYFDFENGQPYTIIPYCTVIRDPRVNKRLNIDVNKGLSNCKQKMTFYINCM